jgi:hypothetical protein
MDVTGCEPIAFEQFAREHAAVFVQVYITRRA